MKLIGTRTTPARAVANASTAYCQQLCASSATRSPGRKPLSCNAGRGPVDQIVELGERQHDIAVDDRGLVRLPAGRPARDIAERMAARPRDSASSSGTSTA